MNFIRAGRIKGSASLTHYQCSYFQVESSKEKKFEAGEKMGSLLVTMTSW